MYNVRSYWNRKQAKHARSIYRFSLEFCKCKRWVVVFFLRFFCVFSLLLFLLLCALKYMTNVADSKRLKCWWCNGTVALQRIARINNIHLYFSMLTFYGGSSFSQRTLFLLSLSLCMSFHLLTRVWVCVCVVVEAFLSQKHFDSSFHMHWWLWILYTSHT